MRTNKTVQEGACLARRGQGNFPKGSDFKANSGGQICKQAECGEWGVTIPWSEA